MPGIWAQSPREETIPKLCKTLRHSIGRTGQSPDSLCFAALGLQVSLWLGAISWQPSIIAAQPSRTKAARALRALLRAESQGAEAVMQVIPYLQHINLSYAYLHIAFQIFSSHH